MEQKWPSHLVIVRHGESERNVASQSEPNHLMLIAASSPIIDNANKNRTYQPQEPFKIQTLPKALEKAKLTWAAYGDPSFSHFEKIEELKGSPNILPWTRFDVDVAAGKLPNVSWIYAPGSPVELSDHPLYGKNAGQQTHLLGRPARSHGRVLWNDSRAYRFGSDGHEPGWVSAALREHGHG